MLVGAERITEGMDAPGMQFHFRSAWSIPGDLVAIWNAIGAVDEWPTWWRSVTTARVIRGPALPVTVGTIAEYRVRSPLGYALQFRSEVTAVERGKWIDTRILGNLAGRGRWDFTHAAGVTSARLAWDVAVTRPFLARVAAVGMVRSAMSWAHDRVMEDGERGLRALVQQRVTSV